MPRTERKGSGPPSNTMRIDYALDTQGAAARAVLASINWTVDDPAAPLRLGGDILVTDSFVLSRLWHTPTRSHRNAPNEQDETGRFVATLIVEGTGVYTIAGEGHAFEPGILLIYDPTLPAAFESAVPVAAIHVSHRWTDILPAGLRREDVPVVSTPPEELAGLFTTMVNATFEQRLDECDLGFAAWLASIDSAVSSLLHNTLRACYGLAHPTTLYERALHIIDEQHTDPTFTVAGLAGHLGVSKAWLHRAFAERGTSPRHALQDARIAHARTQLPRLPTPQEIAAAAAAEASGFATSRALRRALRSDESRPPSADVS
ncbi:helix-turn-helix domain-containing protein [Microbacterium sp. NPDC056052]|uniref:helix-turn-helix domain-containing protein n=1 Tax=Microbacterium sp. NPDC056052 TaxID=3345695 RepID=UPI0035E2C439